ncbi:unnamed protein product [Porites lobata]|uniref:Uncharacterized protein n=1 Tax=Porites lobata TaxID=104759 RepID=A0ABN8S9M1_9CNID|nr:unnamed protein product [Porites lobata]
MKKGAPFPFGTMGHRLILFKRCLKKEIGSQVCKKDLGTSFLCRLKTALKSRKTIKVSANWNNEEGRTFSFLDYLIL